jgi:hypothetical protein
MVHHTLAKKAKAVDHFIENVTSGQEIQKKYGVGVGDFS